MDERDELARTEFALEPPLTEMGASAAQLHEVFLSYQAAGFSAAQSMQLICALVAAHVQKNP